MDMDMRMRPKVSRTSVDLTTKVEGRYPVPGDRERRAAVSSIGQHLPFREDLSGVSSTPSHPRRLSSLIECREGPR